jgi:hypothetical protein
LVDHWFISWFADSRLATPTTWHSPQSR